MNEECKIAFEKTKKLIENRKKRLGSSIKPEIHDLDSGILLQYFENWENFIGTYNDEESTYKIKKRLIKNYDNEIKEIYMSYGTKNKLIRFEVNYDKLFIMLDGCAEFEDDHTKEKWILDKFTAKLFKKNQILNIYGIEDSNYFIVVKFNSPIS